MKFIVLPFLLVFNLSFGQGWEAEVMTGVSGYNGDLTQKLVSFKTLRPGLSINVKYNIDNTIVVRGGISWLNVTADDKYNKQADIKRRNLNFKSTIWEANLCAELNLMEPELFYSYPYVFAGVGLYHFDPYTFDKDNKKTYLQPLGTEGEGIPGYPNRKPYSLTQFCMPVGGGWKFNFNKKYDIIYELGYRLLFTDYLDDVSTTYVSPQILFANKGAKTVELAYRQAPIPDYNLPVNGDTRGNPKVRDGYFFSGLKLLVHLGKDQPK